MLSIKPIILYKMHILDGTSNVKKWNVGVNGKNYFGDWTFSYDYSKATNLWLCINC